MCKLQDESCINLQFARCESRVSGVSNVIQKISVQSPPNSFIFFDTEQVSSKTLISQKEVQSISIRITDSQDRLINTNGVHFALSVQFDTIRTPQFAVPFAARRIGENETLVPHLVGGQVSRVQQLRRLYAEMVKKRKKLKKPVKKKENVE